MTVLPEGKFSICQAGEKGEHMSKIKEAILKGVFSTLSFTLPFLPLKSKWANVSATATATDIILTGFFSYEVDRKRMQYLYLL